MKQSSDAPPAAAEPWVFEQVRVTVFLTRPPSSQLYLALTGTPPQSVNERPAEGVRQEIGSYADNQLSVTAQPGRVDVVLTGKADPSLTTPTIVRLSGTYQNIEVICKALCDKLVVTMDGLVFRVAVAPVFFQQMATVVEASTRLRKAFPSLPEESVNSPDSVVQYSLPFRQIGARTFRCLYKWQVMQMIVAQVVPGFLPTPERFEINLFRLEADIFSPADNLVPFSKLDLASYFQEILSPAIYLTGDV